MKLQAAELPLMKNQTTRRTKTRNAAPLVAIALFLLTLVPIYYPLFRYPSKNSSSDLSSSSRLSLCLDGDSLLDNKNVLCTHKHAKKINPTAINDDQKDSGNDEEEKPPTLDSDSIGDAETKPANNFDSVDTTESGVAFNKDVATKPILSNPDSVDATQSREETTRTPSNGDVETKHVQDNLESVAYTAETTDSSSGTGETTIDGTTETKPVLSDPDSVDTTQSREETTRTPSNGDVETKHAQGNLESVAYTTETTDSSSDGTGEAAIDGKTETKPVLSDPDSESDWAERKNCDIFSGDWVPNPEAPYYTNNTCREIQQHQDCLKFGRPDTQYLKWKWKPEGCELPVFDPYRFLQLVRGKSLAFVGDSVARNHMQSLICLLSRVEEAVDVSDVKYVSQFKRYVYPNHNFTVEIFWSPYLVKATQPDDSHPFNLYLDEFDEKWTTKIEPFDYVIISAGHWFFRPTMFYLQGRIAGCLYCPESNINHLTAYFSYRRAFRTAFRAINSLENFKGVTFLRTFAPSHFEGGHWDKGGDCNRTMPFKKAEARLEGYNLEHYKIQIDEVKIAERLGRRRGLRFRLFDVTRAMWLRPDGHPSKYGHWPQPNVTMANDCVHWCLPGPVDTWNDFLVEMLKREEKALY